MTAATATNNEPRTTNPLVRLLQSEYLVLLLSAAYFFAFLPFTPGFASTENAANILATLLPLFIVAMGQTVVLITGGIDLSVTSIIALCSITGAAVMSGDHGWLAGHPLAVPAGIAAMLLVGALVGLLNGVAITQFRMPPFIVTLTAMMFFSGLAIWLTKSKNIGNLPAAFNALGGKTWLALVVSVPLAAAAHVMLSRSLWGRWLYAVGHNARTSLVSGVPVNGVIVSAYIASGLLAAVAAVLYTGQAESGSPVLAQRLLLDIVGATVIGGTSLFGGKGKILWTFFGVLFLKLIDNSLNLLDLSYFTIMMVKGAVILFAALMDTARTKLGAR
ncbi:MAG: ABC transporter permease [Verrucomicrobia bacterium]|nr:ABC transporter permease [Verrucomicrobiota bacterium]